MRRISALFATVFVLSACSTVMDSATQDVRIATPGVAGALCFVERPGHKVRVFAPQTIHITKSKGPMEVRCLAPGNREKTVVVEPETLGSFYWNLWNPAGMAVDNSTGARYLYPDVITVDFRGIKPSPMPLSDYQYLLKEHPHLANMEEFRAGKSVLQSDRYDTVPTLAPRVSDRSLYGGGGIIGNSSDEGTSGSSGGSSSGSGGLSAPASPSAVAPVSSSSSSAPSARAAGPAKYGNGGGSAEALTRNMNPGVFSGGGRSSSGSGGASAPASAGPASSAPVGISPPE